MDSDFVHIQFIKMRLRIYKPLILLKMALFFWFTSGFSSGTFLNVFLKQRGMNLEEVSLITSVSAVGYLILPTISAAISDRIGNPKPVLLGHLCIFAFSNMCLIFMPTVTRCQSQRRNLHCSEGWLFPSVTTGCNSTELLNCTIVHPDSAAYKSTSKNCSLKWNGNEVTSITNISSNLCEHETLFLSENVSYYCNVKDKNECLFECKSESIHCRQNNLNTFLILSYGVVYFFLTFAMTSVFRLFDVTSLSLVQKHNADFGQQRFFSISGAVVGPILCGYLIRLVSKSNEQNYSISLVFVAIFSLLTIVIVLKLQICVNKSENKMFRKTLALITDMDVCVFFAINLITGSSFSYNGGFKAWLLEEMKASAYVIGLLGGIQHLYGLPFLFTSNWWVERLGVKIIFLLCLFGYAVNCVGFSLLQTPWPAFILELTSIFTYHLFWVAVVRHAGNIAPEGLFSTAIALAGTMHFSVGRLLGYSVYGAIQSVYDQRTAFRIGGIICCICGVLYTLYSLVKLRLSKKGIVDKGIVDEGNKEIHQARL